MKEEGKHCVNCGTELDKKGFCSDLEGCRLSDRLKTTGKIHPHTMRLHPNPFYRIKSGKKKVEMRLNDLKRQKLKVGHTIIFKKRPDFRETLKVKITKLRKFKTYADLINHYSLEDLDLKNKTKEQIIKEGAVYYPEDKIKKYGFLVIEIKLI